MRSPADCKILIVDDTESNIDLLVETLSSDYTIGVAMDGGSALEHAAEQLPDLILLDIMMPGMDGYEVIKELKTNPATADIPVIFCTVMSEEEDEREGLELGAIDYITKPFSSPIVKARVKNHLQLKLAQEGLKEQNAILCENFRLREKVENITRHDLKTSLNAFINVPELLIQEGDLSGEQVESLQMLSKSAYHMLEMINNSLDLYKMEVGGYQTHLIPVDLIKLLGQIRSETQVVARAKKLNLNVLLDGRPAGAGDEFLVAGEEMLCYSLFANLITNAMEASPEGEAIEVALKDSFSPMVEIHNLGVVPEGIRDRFFEKYSTSGKEGGSGLGTYFAALTAKTLGGNINFETSEEMGTTVIVELTRILKESRESLFQEEPAMRSPRLLSRPVPLSARKILVVDDNKIMRLLIIKILMQMGFSSFREAADGLLAKRILEKERIDLVISDLSMPNMTSFELLDFARSTRGLWDVPFIIVSGESHEGNVLEAAKRKIAGFILKPFHPDLLKAKVQKIFS